MKDEEGTGGGHGDAQRDPGGLAIKLASATGVTFFRSLAQYLARELGTDCALLAEFSGPHLSRTRTIAVCVRGKLVENFQRELKGTPCEQVVAAKHCYYPSGVQQRFPRDGMLADMGAASYMGAALTDSAGCARGVLAVLHGQPLPDPELARSTLRLFAGRASSELEHTRAETALKRETSFKKLLQLVAAASNKTSSFEDAMRTTLDLVCGHTGWLAGHAYVVAEESERRLLPTAIWHLDFPERFAKFREITEATPFVRGIGLPGRVLESARPAWITDVTKDANFPRAQLVRDIPTRAACAFPVMVESEVAAVLEFFSDDLLEPDEPLLEVMAHIGTVLGRVVERERAQVQLGYLIHYDALTGLPHRALFSERLERALTRSRWSKRVVALLYVGLDRFQLVNDSLGHDKGDRALRACALRLKHLVREGDSVARLASDEFVILLEEMGSVDDSAPIARKVLDSFSHSFKVESEEIYLSASIGISVFPVDGDEAQSLLRCAHTSMTRAKQRGGRQCCFYSSTMGSAAAQRFATESCLHGALERQEFLLHYQPQIDLGTGSVGAAECLIRWQHPERGLVWPPEFITVLEESGLIVPVGEWVLRSACLQNRVWQAAGFPEQRVAVNLSARQFVGQDLAHMVARVLDETGLDPRHLELELTESALIESTDEAVRSLCQLDAMGVRLAIDDFGTGYSSLSYLQRFPIHTVKIDHSFIRDITTAADGAEITTAIIAMAHALGLRVVAEGVETEEQVAFLREKGCDAMQGHLFSPALPVDELTCLLGKRVGSGPRAVRRSGTSGSRRNKCVRVS